ncbi:MAG TPA: OmpA family protein, partial [Candidatus Poseidoniales archaeon]
VNQYDLCVGTPPNAMVNAAGCANTQLDSDNDGINDALDSCPS